MQIYGFYPTMQSISFSILVVMLHFNNLYIISGLVVIPKNWIFMGLETVYNPLKIGHQKGVNLIFPEIRGYIDYRKQFRLRVILKDMWNYFKDGISVSVVLDARTLNKEGKYPVKMKVYYQKKPKYYSTGICMTEGAQQAADQFGDTHTTTKRIGTVSTSTVKYDLVGEIAKGATLTRRTVVAILKGISQTKLYMFRNNPEEFIRKTIRIIKEQKATMIVEHISYNKIEETYDSTIFTKDKHTQPIEKAYAAKKHVMDYVFPDSKGETEFAGSLDSATEVCVYAKLPRAFQIPTPVGNYAPDWAIAFNRGTVKHIFFIAETKGSMDTMEMRGVEKAKIECAEKLFNNVSTSHVRYHRVTSYQNLLDEIRKLD